MIIAAIAPAIPIPKTFALEAFNYYSVEDTTTGRYGKAYLNDKKNDDIRFVESLKESNSLTNLLQHLPRGDSRLLSLARAHQPMSAMAVKAIQQLPPGDHSFQGNTYQAVLKEIMKQMRNKYEFCKKNH